MNLELVTPPVGYPVTLAEAKANSREDWPDQDVLIAGLIATATAYLDGRNGILGLALLTQIWKQRLDDFPRGGKPLGLPFAPVQSITSIKYWDTESPSVEITWGAANYEFQAGDYDPFISLADEAFYPATKTRRDAVTIEFKAGYGDALAVPTPLKQAILLMVSEHYERREMAIVAASYTPTGAVDALIAPYRRFNF